MHIISIKQYSVVCLRCAWLVTDSALAPVAVGKHCDADACAALRSVPISQKKQQNKILTGKDQAQT